MTEPADYGMFTAEGNAAVAALIEAAKAKAGTEAEADVLAWIGAEAGRIAADDSTYPCLPDLADEPGETVTGMREVRDTAVREAIGTELNDSWERAYGHKLMTFTYPS